MSAVTGELSLVTTIPFYDYSKLGFAYLTMLGLAEQVTPHMRVWRPWATAANYVMRMAPIIYWNFQARPFPLIESSPEGNPGHPILEQDHNLGEVWKIAMKHFWAGTARRGHNRL
ncbi:hypothetical protein DSO57_1021690 [Entomophthora muscae]|uniref:Uncharacterized protein n=1 Tax=Entomophthora muscae TaxID=34485 RepID=A0ACC2SSJ6_9FUNG|nr:hypothetical protein DSO57_1021690 [Entomophthora muscae]